jgi:hypothetical protein
MRSLKTDFLHMAALVNGTANISNCPVVQRGKCAEGNMHIETEYCWKHPRWKRKTILTCHFWVPAHLSILGSWHVVEDAEGSSLQEVLACSHSQDHELVRDRGLYKDSGG